MDVNALVLVVVAAGVAGAGVAAGAVAVLVLMRRADQEDRVEQGLEEARIAHQLSRVTDLVTRLESERAGQLGELQEAIRLNRAGVAELVQTTQGLREALSSTKARGQWGERMADDVLRLAGFVENVNYRKQRAVEGGRAIPDFTFVLPNDLVLNMDVKFPLDNYLRALEAPSEHERRRLLEQFRRDVRARIRELDSRAYIDPGGSTVDFVLLFIPNEQLYAAIHEIDHAIIEESTRRHVVLCSPLTLFAVLALIRQMVETFQLARTSDEILEVLGQFRDQWQRFTDQMQKVGDRIDAAQREHHALVGTRARMLEKPLQRIDELRSPRGIAAVPSG